MKFLALFLLLIPTAFAQDTIGTIPLRRSQPANLQGPGMGTTTTIDRQNPTMSSEWDGIQWMHHSVTTPRDIGESQTAQAARHIPAVFALQREFPAVAVGLNAPLDHSRGTLTPPSDDPEAASVGRADSVMRTTWKDADNLTHTVETPRNGGESVASQANRHAVAVRALAMTFKPVAPSVGFMLIPSRGSWDRVIYPAVTRQAA